MASGGSYYATSGANGSDGMIAYVGGSGGGAGGSGISSSIYDRVGMACLDADKYTIKWSDVVDVDFNIPHPVYYGVDTTVQEVRAGRNGEIVYSYKSPTHYSMSWDFDADSYKKDVMTFNEWLKMSSKPKNEYAVELI